MTNMYNNELFMHDNTPFEKRISQLLKSAHSIKNDSLDYELKGCKQHDLHLESSYSANFRFGNGREQFLLMPFAASQLCSKIGMPWSFYRKLVSSKDVVLQRLALETFNQLATHHQEGIVLRTYKDIIRGVVSSKYCAFDTDAILDVFVEAFKDSKILSTDETVMRGDYIGLDLFSMRFTHREPIKGVPDKDLFYGMQLTSSDVGRSSIRLRFYVYKQVCSNGLCVNLFNQELLTQRHIHVKKDYVYAAMLESFKAFPEMMIKVNEYISAAGEHSLRKNPLLLSETPTKKQYMELRNQMQKYLKISEGGMNELAMIVASDYEPTVWGYINAITKYAQRFDVERRMELESLAGNLLTNFDRFKQVA